MGNPRKNDYSEAIASEFSTDFMVWSQRTVLADPKQGQGSNPVHRENPRKPFFPRYLRVGRTSSDVIPTAIIITTITHGLGSNESVASGRVTRTHSLAEEYKARRVPNSPIPSILRKNAVFQPISFAEAPRAAWGRLTNSVEACEPIRVGMARSGWGRPASGLTRGFPVAQVFNLRLSIAAARCCPDYAAATPLVDETVAAPAQRTSVM